jgi:hypothetical protein
MRKSILFMLGAAAITASACANTDKQTPESTAGFVRTQADRLV